MSSKTLRVRAVKGLRVPRDNAPRTYIEATPVIVPASLYYRRRINAGELVELPVKRTKREE